MSILGSVWVLIYCSTTAVLLSVGEGFPMSILGFFVVKSAGKLNRQALADTVTVAWHVAAGMGMDCRGCKRCKGNTPGI